jgi:hypothetical protein
VLDRFLVSLITLSTSVTSTLLIGGKKHDNLWQKGSVGGGGDLTENTFLSRAGYQILKLSCYLILQSLCTRSSHQVGLMLVVGY